MYRIRHQQAARYTALRDVIAQKCAAPFRKVARAVRPAAGPAAPEQKSIEDFWALKNVSFQVQTGEVVGIIGRNGAGKSTLLKLLSRITEPTTGSIRLRGRVASLLEVGTGFHPELTGRENIYLNGAILGMHRVEIKRKFDEIVAFSEVEKFLDTPVKRYSSGMYVRLAFAVAAHLEPEILVVDEVLAVGDAQFQKKCLGKMSNVAKEGRTILFVSHNLSTVQSLCTRGVLLAGGSIAAMGLMAEVIDRYQRIIQEGAGAAQTSGRVIKGVVLRNGSNQSASTFLTGEAMEIAVTLDTGDEEIKTPFVGLGVNSTFGQRIFTVGNYLSTDTLPAIKGRREVVCRISALPLAPGGYSIKVAVAARLGEDFEQIENVISFDVIANDFFGNGRMPDSQQGVMVVRSQWGVLQ
jgi:lipopolysaccharide transport system ATP-binding protein